MSPLVFDYQPKGFREPRPWLPTKVFRPYARLKVKGILSRIAGAVLDTGADEITLPLKMADELAERLNVQLQSGGQVRHEGILHDSSRGQVELALEGKGASGLRWSTRVRFAPAQEYPLLGLQGFFQYVDVTFFGRERRAEVRPNDTFDGHVALAQPRQLAPYPGITRPPGFAFAYEEDARYPGRLYPLAPIRLSGTTNTILVKQAFVDTGSPFCLFPLSYARQIGVEFLDDGHWTRSWGGAKRQMRFGKVRLELAPRTDRAAPWSWTAGVAFLDVPPDDPCFAFSLLGQIGFLEFMDATFLGKGQLRLVTNASFPDP